MDTEICITTHDAHETLALARSIGASCSGGSVFALVGDLGSGKTAFVQGLALGLGVPETCYVTSPTFAIVNEYCGRFRLFHIDLYRIGDPVDLEELGIMDMFTAENVVAIEWPRTFLENYISDYITITLTVVDENTRDIHIRSCGSESEQVLSRCTILKGTVK